MNIQWYPGHMTKARREMAQACRLVDMVIELVDARIPLSGRNPDIDTLAAGKARVVVLSKADLADPELTEAWKEYFRRQGVRPVDMDARSRAAMKAVRAAIGEASAVQKEKNRRKGIVNRPVRAMVAGIPNVGKSTFINSFAGKASAKTGNRPGVTKGNQWIRLSRDVELLDTPGILWPKFEDAAIGVRIALVGSVSEEILDRQALACEGLAFLSRNYPGAAAARYGIEERLEDGMVPAAAMLEELSGKRGCLARGGVIDTEKGAGIFLEEFRNGKICRLTLERPEEPGR